MANLFHMPIATAMDTSGAASAAAKLFFFADGTSTPLDTYSDSALTKTNTNPVIADTAGRFSAIYLKNDQQYKVVLQDSSSSELWSVDDVSGADAGQYAVDTGSANAYVVAFDPPISSYFSGLEINVKILNTNTSSSTINVNGKGTKALQLNQQAFTGGEVTANDVATFIYDGTQFQMTSPTLLPMIKTQQFQTFGFRLVNTGGTLQHSFFSGQQGNAFNFGAKVSGSVATLTNTPTGTDSSTAMAAGCKIGSANGHFIHFDTAAIILADFIGVATIQHNTTTTDIEIATDTANIDINGTTRRRLAVFFTDTATGASFSLTTGNIASGKLIDIRFKGNLP